MFPKRPKIQDSESDLKTTEHTRLESVKSLAIFLNEN